MSTKTGGLHRHPKTGLPESQCGDHALGEAKLRGRWVWATNVDPDFNIATGDLAVNTVFGRVRCTFEGGCRQEWHHKLERREMGLLSQLGKNT